MNANAINVKQDHEAIGTALADRRFVVVVTSHSGRVIRQEPRPTIGRAEKDARRFRVASWVASAEVEEVTA